MSDPDNVPRPVLVLKRRSPASAEDGADTLSQVVSRRKQIVVNITPRHKKRKTSAETPVVQKSTSPAAGQEAVSIRKMQAGKAGQAFVVPPEIAVKILRAFWPGLFDGERLRPLAVGMREALFQNAEHNEFPLSRKQIVRCLKSLTRTVTYQSSIVAGAARYDLHGAVRGHATTDDEAYARERVMQRQRRKTRT